MKKTNLSVLNNYKGFKYKSKAKILKIFNGIINEPSIINKLNKVFIDAEKFSFDIVFTSDDEIKAINRDYRNIDKATDVITFSLFADDKNSFAIDNEINLGEIIISIDTAKRQAIKSYDVEIDTLITHGILHLLGFDHQTDEDYNFIVGVQNKIIEDLYNA